MRRYCVLMLALGLLPASAELRAQPADEVGQALAEATTAYQAGSLSAARTAVQEALQFLMQRFATALAAALPAALPGWTAEAPEAQANPLAALGAGTQASRRYNDTRGLAVQVSITADSPIVAQLGMVLQNPAMAGAMGRLVRIGTQRAIQTNDNEPQMLIDNRVLVTVTGDAPVEAKLAYARSIDMAKVMAALR